MKFNLKSLALCAAMLSFGFAENNVSYEDLYNNKVSYENLYDISFGFQDSDIQKIEINNQDNIKLELCDFARDNGSKPLAYNATFKYGNDYYKVLIYPVLDRSDTRLKFNIKSLTVSYSGFSENIGHIDFSLKDQKASEENIVTYKKDVTDKLKEYGLSAKKLIAISQKMIKMLCDKIDVPEFDEFSKKCGIDVIRNISSMKILENTNKRFDRETQRLGNIEWEEDTKEVQQETDKPIHYTLLEKNVFDKNTEMYIKSKKVDDPTTATYKLYYNNNKFEINFTNADTFNVVLTIGKKGFDKKTNIILDQNDNLNIKKGQYHYTNNHEVDASTYADVNKTYQKEIKDMEEIVKRIKLQKDLIFDTFRKNS